MNWDKYFHNICVAVASKSSCLSRQIGVVLVRDHSIVSTGYNGPARGYKHCEGVSNSTLKIPEGIDTKDIVYKYICPRIAANYKSGQGLHICPAAHAEVNAISNAARQGTHTHFASLYMNSIIPCKNCATTIVNAGIFEVVVDELTYYDIMSKEIFKSANVLVRSFE